MEPLQRMINDLVIANRILAHHGVFDEYGHVSVRHPSDPAQFLLARDRIAAFVEPGDIVAHMLDGSAATDDNRLLCAERFLAMPSGHDAPSPAAHAYPVDRIPAAADGYLPQIGGDRTAVEHQAQRMSLRGEMTRKQTA